MITDQRRAQLEHAGYSVVRGVKGHHGEFQKSKIGGVDTHSLTWEEAWDYVNETATVQPTREASTNPKEVSL